MKKLLILLFVVAFKPLFADCNYFLDTVITQKIESIRSTDQAFVAVSIIDKIQKVVDEKKSLQFIESLFHEKDFVSFFLLEESQNLKDLKIALGAKIYLYCLHCSEQKVLLKAMKMYDSLDYWKHESFNEGRSWYQKNFLRWANSLEYKKSVDSKINELQFLSKKTESFLGLIRNNKQLLLKSSSLQNFQENLTVAIKTQDDFLHSINETDNSNDIYLVIINMIENFTSFNLKLSEQYKENQPPSNIVRNWQAYTLGTVTVCAAAYAAYIYQNEVIESAQAFWKDKVQGPVQKISDALTGKGSIPHFDSTEEKAQYHTLILREHGESAPMGSDFSGIGAATQQTVNYLDFQKWIPWGGSQELPADQLSLEQLSELEQQVLRYDQVSIANPDKNVLSVVRAYERTLLRQVIDIKKQANIVLQELYEDNRLTLSIAAFIPAITLLGGGSFASKKIYNSISIQPLRKIIRDLELFLNNIIHQSVSFEKEGRLFLLTELLHQKSSVLNFRDSQMMEEDLLELQSESLTYEQKFYIVQRMYYTYGFLFPGAI